MPMARPSAYARRTCDSIPAAVPRAWNRWNTSARIRSWRCASGSSRYWYACPGIHAPVMATRYMSFGTSSTSIISTHKPERENHEKNLATDGRDIGDGGIRGRGRNRDHVLLPRGGRRPHHQDHRPDVGGLRAREPWHQGEARVHGNLPGVDREGAH